MFIRAVAFCTACTALHCLAFARVVAEEPVLASYFEIASDLVVNSQARDALEISPAQEEGLRKMLKDSAILQKVSAEWRAIRRQHPEWELETGQRLAQSRIDDLVQSELAKVLSPQQLERAKLAFIRQKYSSGISPFADRELLSQCGMSPRDVEQLKPVLDDASKKLISDIDKVCAEAAMHVLEVMPEESKKLFVTYAGNKYLPAIKVDTAIGIDALPYSPFVRPGGSVKALLSPEHTAQELGLTEEQLGKLRILQSSHQSRVSSTSRGGRTASQIRQILNEGSTGSLQAFETILTKEQLLKLYRSRARSEFVSDLVKTLDRQELVTYLRLTDEQTVQVRQRGLEASRNKIEQSNKLQQEAFEQLCSRIEPVPRAVLSKLFSGVWMPIE